MPRERFDYLGGEDTPRKALFNRFFAHIVVLVIAVILLIGVAMTIADRAVSDDALTAASSSVSSAQTV